jgi:hypothetical protein
MHNDDDCDDGNYCIQTTSDLMNELYDDDDVDDDDDDDDD